MLRQCRIALLLGEAVGADPDEQAAAFYLGLLAWVGCTADSHEIAETYGDDLAVRAESYGVEMAGRSGLGFLLRRTGAGQSGRQRAQAIASVVANRGSDMTSAMNTHCLMASDMAEQLGLGPEISEPIRHVFERWDGRGVPGDLRAQRVPLAVRLVQLADIAEVHHSRRGLQGAIDEIRRRSGRQFDPDLAALFCERAGSIFDALEHEPTWDAVLEAEPEPWRWLDGDEIDNALEAVADFVDLKAPWFTGHSRGVSRLAADAAIAAGMPVAEVDDIRRAGLVHDLGRIGVPTTIWNKPGSLTHAELERVRMHPYLTERVLARSPALARLGGLAGCHHERLDGSGYHRGLNGSSLSPGARILAVADTYQAMSEPRPYRPALEPEAAATALRAEVRAGRLDGDAVEDVLQAAGHSRAATRDRARPAGLTAREMEVLILLARGSSASDVAEELVIAEKTARNHTERVYLKLGVSSRAEVAVYAMRHGLIN